MRKCIAILAVAIALAGCGSMEKKVIGKYQLQAVAKGENDRAATSMVNGFMGMLTFEIKVDHTVTTTLPGDNVAGAWSVSGDQITMTMPDGKDKIVATISSDGRTLTPIAQDGKTTMKFVRVEE